MSESTSSAEGGIVNIAAQVEQVIGAVPQSELIAAQHHIGTVEEATAGLSIGADTAIAAELHGAGQALKAANEKLEKGRDELSRYLAVLGIGGNAAVVQATAGVQSGELPRAGEQKKPWEAAYDPDLLIDLPPLPYEMNITASGEVYVTDPLSDVPLPDKLRIYIPQRATPERRAELEEIARKAGISMHQLATVQVEAAAIEADPRIRRGAKMLLEYEHSETYVPLLSILYAAQNAALQQAYVDAIAARGRALLQRYAPDAVPREANVIVSLSDMAAGCYYGKFDDIHVISISPPHIVTRQDVETASAKTEDAVVVAHELAHQHHAELTDMQMPLGTPEVMAAGAIAATDPHDLLARAFRHAEENYSIFEDLTEQQRLVGSVYSALAEVYAYTVESEIRLATGIPPVVAADDSLEIIEDPDYTPALVLLLGPNAPVNTAEIKSTILAVDLKAIALLSKDELSAILKDPLKLLALPKR